MNGNKIEGLVRIQKHARAWLFDCATPFWSTLGVLDDGMFAERIALDGTPSVEIHRRLRVQARQIYSFCAIGQLGWSGRWQKTVSRAADQMIGVGRRADGLFVHLFDARGVVADSRVDLYDHAFGLFALAHAAQALERPDLANIADEILAHILTNWSRSEGGFWEGELTGSPPYRQNPHMHLFEAALSDQRAGGKGEWAVVAERMDRLFHEKFQDAQTGAVCEYFDADWKPLADEDHAFVEPGHCLEWAWLFEMRGKTITSDRLTAFARRFGIDSRTGVVVNELHPDGRIRDGEARLWPQTERLKAAIARFRRLRNDEECDEIVAAYKGLCLYLDVPVRGLWRDRLRADGQWVDEAAPASSFYHIVCSLNELLRLEV